MPTPTARSIGMSMALILMALALLVATGIASRQASAGTSIVVNSTAHPGAGACDPAECTLHEALTLANANAGQDTITFNPGVFPSGAPSTISVTATALPASNDPDGLIVSGEGAGVTIDGSALGGDESGLVFHSAGGGIDLTGVVVRSITVQNFPGTGILVCGGPIVVLECDEDLSGTELRNVNVRGNGEHGIEIRGTNISNTTLADCDSTNNATAGVRVAALQQLTFTSVSSCSAIDNGAQGIRLRGSTGASNMTVSDVTVTGNTNDGVWLRSPGDISDVSIDDVTAIDNATGVHVDATGSVTDVSLSSITSMANSTGIKIEGADITDATVESSIVMTNTTGIEVEGLAEVHFNRIVGNTVGVEQGGAGTLNAEINWWGCNNGPNTAGCDTTTGAVDGAPWLVLGLSVDPASIPAGGTAALLADLTVNSGGSDTSALGAVSDEIQISFTTDLGSVGSKQFASSLVNGIAEATLTADEGPGTADVTAALDNVTLAEAVEITSATPTPSPSPTPAVSARLWGDLDCKGDVGTRDNQALLRNVLEQPPLSQEGDCPTIGAQITADGNAGTWGDLDCRDGVQTRDNQALLRSVLEQPALSQTQPCPVIGDLAQISD